MTSFEKSRPLDTIEEEPESDANILSSDLIEQSHNTSLVFKIVSEFHSNTLANIVDSLLLLIKLWAYFNITICSAATSVVVSYSRDDRPLSLHDFLLDYLNLIINKEITNLRKKSDVPYPIFMSRIASVKLSKIRDLFEILSTKDYAQIGTASTIFLELKQIHEFHDFIEKILTFDFDSIRNDISFLNRMKHYIEIFYGCSNVKCNNYIPEEKTCSKCSSPYSFRIINYLNLDSLNDTLQNRKEVSILNAVFIAKLNNLNNFYSSLMNYIDYLILNVNAIKLYLSDDDSQDFLYEFDSFKRFYYNILYKEFITLVKSLNVDSAEHLMLK